MLVLNKLRVKNTSLRTLECWATGLISVRCLVTNFPLEL